MKTLVLHEQVALETARPDEVDVLAQADFAERSLREAGLAVTRLALGADVSALCAAIAQHRPDVVVNLVESLDGSARRIAEAPAWLEAHGIAFTGASSRALVETSDKLATKRRLRARGLPTPEWVERGLADCPEMQRIWILKPVLEDGSVGIDDTSVVSADAATLQRLLDRDDDGSVRFAEAYIEGRELNVAVLGTPSGLVTLPVAEIRFDAFPEGKPRIVGYAAKWDADSFEYRETPRSFELAACDAPLLCQVEQLALRCCELFELDGYARVDFRVDAQGRPWILEVNANPCLAPDAGFVHAAARAGWTPPELFRCLVERAHARTLS